VFPGEDHFTVIGRLAAPGHPLFRAVLDQIRGPGGHL
jgi:hypothetical protein